MRVLKTQKFVLFILLAICTAVLLLATRNYEAATSQNQDNSKSNRVEERQLPLAILSDSSSIDPKEQVLRRTRSSRYDKRYPISFDKLPPDTKQRLVVADHWTTPPVLPTLESDAVVLGEIIDAKGYLSNDKTGAYSEYIIRIQRIIKGNSEPPLSPGEMLTAEREGADVQLPDGRIIQNIIAHQGTPRVGRRYVFFLRYNELGKDYRILTGYEIREGRVFPLDEEGEFANYAESDEATLLERLHKDAALSSPRKKRLDQ